MARMRLPCCAFLLLVALPVAVHAGVIVVDPAGGSNFDDIPEAMFRGAADDTVLVLPGFYEVEAGIHDCHDSMLAGVCFVIEPWRTTPGCDATPAEPSSWGAIKAMHR